MPRVPAWAARQEGGRAGALDPLSSPLRADIAPRGVGRSRASGGGYQQAQAVGSSGSERAPPSRFALRQAGGSVIQTAEGRWYRYGGGGGGGDGGAGALYSASKAKEQTSMLSFVLDHCGEELVGALTDAAEIANPQAAELRLAAAGPTGRVSQGGGGAGGASPKRASAVGGTGSHSRSTVRSRVATALGSPLRASRTAYPGGRASRKGTVGASATKSGSPSRHRGSGREPGGGGVESKADAEARDAADETVQGELVRAKAAAARRIAEVIREGEVAARLDRGELQQQHQQQQAVGASGETDGKHASCTTSHGGLMPAPTPMRRSKTDAGGGSSRWRASRSLEAASIGAPGDAAAARIVDADDLPPLGEFEPTTASKESVAACAAAAQAMAALGSQQKWSDLAAGDLEGYLDAADKQRAEQAALVRRSFARLHMGWQELAMSLVRALGCVEARRQALARERDAALLRRQLIRAELKSELDREQRERDAQWQERLDRYKALTAEAQARTAEVRESLQAMGDAVDAGDAVFTVAGLHKDKLRLQARVRDEQDAKEKVIREYDEQVEKVKEVEAESLALRSRAAAAKADVRALQRRYDHDVGKRESASMRLEDSDALDTAYMQRQVAVEMDGHTKEAGTVPPSLESMVLEKRTRLLLESTTDAVGAKGWALRVTAARFRAMLRPIGRGMAHPPCPRPTAWVQWCIRAILLSRARIDASVRAAAGPAASWYAPLADYAYAWFAGDHLSVREIERGDHDGQLGIGPAGPLSEIARLALVHGTSSSSAIAAALRRSQAFRPTHSSREAAGWERQIGPGDADRWALFYGAKELSTWSAEGRIFLQLLDGATGSDGLEYVLMALRLLLSSGADTGVSVPDKAMVDAGAQGAGGTDSSSAVWTGMETVRWWGARYGPRWVASSASDMPLVVRMLPFDSSQEMKLAQMERVAEQDADAAVVHPPLWFDCEKAVGRERLNKAYEARREESYGATAGTDAGGESTGTGASSGAGGQHASDGAPHGSDCYDAASRLGPVGWEDPETEVDDGGVFEPAPDSRADVLPPHASEVPWRKEWRLLPARRVWIPMARATSAVVYLLRAAPAEQRAAALKAVREKSRLAEGRLPRHMSASQRKSAAALLRGMRGHESLSAMATSDKAMIQRMNAEMEQQNNKGEFVPADAAASADASHPSSSVGGSAASQGAASPSRRGSVASSAIAGDGGASPAASRQRRRSSLVDLNGATGTDEQDDDAIELISHQERMDQFYRRELRCVDLFEVLEVLLRVYRREQAARDAELVHAMQQASQSPFSKEVSVRERDDSIAGEPAVDVDSDGDDDNPNLAAIPYPPAPRDGWRRSRAARPCDPIASHCREDEVLEAVRAASKLPSFDALAGTQAEQDETGSQPADAEEGSERDQDEAGNQQQAKAGKTGTGRARRDRRRHRRGADAASLLLAPETISEGHRDRFLLGQASTSLSMRQTLQVLAQLCPSVTLLEACGVFADAYFVYSGLMAKTAVRLGGAGRVNVASLWRSIEARGLLARSLSLPELSADGWAPAVENGRIAGQLAQYAAREQGLGNGDSSEERDLVAAAASGSAVAAQAAQSAGMWGGALSRNLLLAWTPQQMASLVHVVSMRSRLLERDLFGLGSRAVVSAAAGAHSGDVALGKVLQSGLGMLPASVQRAVLEARHTLATETQRALGLEPPDEDVLWTTEAALSMPRLRMQAARRLADASILSASQVSTYGGSRVLNEPGKGVSGPADTDPAVVAKASEMSAASAPPDGRRMLQAYRRYLLALLRAKHCVLEDSGDLGGTLAVVRSDRELAALENALRSGPLPVDVANGHEGRTLDEDSGAMGTASTQPGRLLLTGGGGAVDRQGDAVGSTALVLSQRSARMMCAIRIQRTFRKRCIAEGSSLPLHLRRYVHRSFRPSAPLSLMHGLAHLEEASSSKGSTSDQSVFRVSPLRRELIKLQAAELAGLVLTSARGSGAASRPGAGRFKGAAHAKAEGRIQASVAQLLQQQPWVDVPQPVAPRGGSQDYGLAARTRREHLAGDIEDVCAAVLEDVSVDGVCRDLVRAVLSSASIRPFGADMAAAVGNPLMHAAAASALSASPARDVVAAPASILRSACYSIAASDALLGGVTFATAAAVPLLAKADQDHAGRALARLLVPQSAGWRLDGSDVAVLLGTGSGMSSMVRNLLLGQGSGLFAGIALRSVPGLASLRAAIRACNRALKQTHNEVDAGESEGAQGMHGAVAYGEAGDGLALPPPGVARLALAAKVEEQLAALMPACSESACPGLAVAWPEVVSRTVYECAKHGVHTGRANTESPSMGSSLDSLSSAGDDVLVVDAVKAAGAAWLAWGAVAGSFCNAALQAAKAAAPSSSGVLAAEAAKTAAAKALAEAGNRFKPATHQGDESWETSHVSTDLATALDLSISTHGSVTGGINYQRLAVEGQYDILSSSAAAVLDSLCRLAAHLDGVQLHAPVDGTAAVDADSSSSGKHATLEEGGAGRPDEPVSPFSDLGGLSAASALRVCGRGLVDDCDCLAALKFHVYRDVDDPGKHKGGTGGSDGGGVLRTADVRAARSLVLCVLKLQDALDGSSDDGSSDGAGAGVGASPRYSLAATALETIKAWREFRFSGASIRAGAVARVAS